MSGEDTINAFIRHAGGNRAGGRDGFYKPKKSFISEDVADELRRQWGGAGRDTARVWLKFTEVDGTNPHFVTGWDGKGTYVCLTEQGLSYISAYRLAKLNLDEEWNSRTLLVHIRMPLLREKQENSRADALLNRCRASAPKPKPRQSRFSRLAEAEDKKAKVTATGPESSTEMGPAPKYPTDAPKAPPGQDEALSWSAVDETTGKVKRRGLNHPKMKQDAKLPNRELVDVRDENLHYLCGRCGVPRTAVSEAEGSCAECGARELVTVRKEGGSAKGVSASEGKAPAELDNREKVDVRNEAAGGKCTGCDYEGPKLTYWGDKIYCAECAAREQVDVRHEAESRFGDKFADKKSPLGAKKPLVLFMLMKKGRSVGESVGRPLGEAKLPPKFKLVKRPDDETERQEVDSREGVDESTGRRSFKIAAKTEDGDWHKAHAHKFYANMMKFKSRSGRSRKPAAKPAARPAAKTPPQSISSSMFGCQPAA